MIVLDENFPEGQRRLLGSWRIPFRQIGQEVGRSGMADDEVIPLLLQVRRPTFFTLDFDFHRRTLCHRRYCIVVLDVKQYEAAASVRRLLRHPGFDTEAKRMGAVLLASHSGIELWRLHEEHKAQVVWIDHIR